MDEKSLQGQRARYGDALGLGRKEGFRSLSPGQCRGHVTLARPWSASKRVRGRGERGEGQPSDERPSYPRRSGRRVSGLPTTPTRGEGEGKSALD